MMKTKRIPCFRRKKVVVDVFDAEIRKAAENVVSLGVTCASLGVMTFPEFKACMSKAVTLNTTAGFIKLMWHVTTAKNLRDNGVESAATSVSMQSFFKAYMITFFSGIVFGEIGQMEVQLVAEALDMVQTFEKFLYGVKNGVDSFQQIVSDAFCLPHKIRDFQNKLKIWIINDKKKNVRRIKDELRTSWQLLNLLETETGPYWIRTVSMLRVRDQKLRCSLLSIAGEEAVTVLDTECSILGKRPRSIDTQTAQFEVSRLLTQQPEAVIANGIRGYTMERITHELLLDSGFRIDANTDLHASELAKRVGGVLQNVFWDSLVNDLSLPVPCNKRFLRLLTEFYEDMGTLFQSKTTTDENKRNKLSNMVDMCNVFDAAKHVTTTQWDLCKFVLETIWEFICESFKPESGTKNHKHVGVPGLCNGNRKLLQPSSNAEHVGYAYMVKNYVDQWSQLCDALQAGELCLDVRPVLFCNALRFLKDGIRTLRVRLTNERLPLIQFQIARQGVGYERKKFEKKFGQQTVNTDAWIRLCVERETSNGGRMSVEDLMRVDNLKSWRYEFIVQAALVNVITDETALVNAETLFLDLCHVADMQQQVQHCVSMCCKHFGVKTISEDNAIFQIFKRRISSLLLYRPQDPAAPFYVDGGHMKNVLLGLQLGSIPDDVVRALCVLLGKMHRVLDINIQVHYDRYNAIISRAVEEIGL